MSKITFRADDGLIDQLEEVDTSKSQVMRDALRTYLDGAEETDNPESNKTIDSALTARVDELISDRLGPARSDNPGAQPATPEINLTVNLEGSAVENADTAVDAQVGSAGQSPDHTTRDPHESGDSAAPETVTCGSCGVELSTSDVYCPNCGEKESHRVFCECGDEIRSDWSFCPGCGRRTPAANVLGDR